MFKKTRLKIIISIILTTILLISILGITCIQIIKNNNLQEEITANISKNIIFATIAILAISILLTLIIGKIISKYVIIYPVDKLMKSGDKTVIGKENVIDAMTSELK